MKKYIFFTIIVILIVCQFFPIDKTNPEVDSTKDFLTMENPPTEVKQLIKTACYDCHSNETQYPWYTNVAPISWWIKKHIDNGRKKLNYSNWGDYEADKKQHKLKESAEEIHEKQMPLLSYFVMHPEAKLDDTQRQMIVDWIKSKQ